MAGATTIHPPASSTVKFSPVNDPKPSEPSNHQSPLSIYISPTFKSSALFAPHATPKQYNQLAQLSQRSFHLPVKTQPDKAPSPTCTSNPTNNTKDAYAWGTHIHQYAGIGDLSFLGKVPKATDLYVARSHRHFLSGQSYVRHDVITRKQITPFKKALNREHDDLVPPASNIPIENYSRLIEECKFVKEDKYASHQNKTAMFPRRGEDKLSEQTEEAISQLLSKRYGQTTYSENFYDQRANTTLELRPLFQFGEKHLEDNREMMSSAVVDSGNETESEKDDTVTANTASGVPLTNSDSNTSVDSLASIASLKSDDEFELNGKEKDESKEVDERCEKATWPCWPGHLTSTIDPVTLGIAEKSDVVCLGDLKDVRALPMFQPRAVPDFNLLTTVDHSSTNDKKFSPAKIDFARSGVGAEYGSAAERAVQEGVIKIEKSRNSRFTKLPDYILDNVERRCSVNGQMLPKNRQFPDNQPEVQSTRVCISPMFDGNTGGRKRIRSSRINSAKKESQSTPKDDSLQQLRDTVSNLQEPNKVMFNCDNKNHNNKDTDNSSYKLPPLWETLSYSSDRVVDQLGNRYKTAAQKRYHDQYQEKTPARIYMPHAASAGQWKNMCIYASDLTRRRQYYNGYHMGSSYR